VRNPAPRDRLSFPFFLSQRQKSGIHLKITGLANYKIRDRVAWYDKMQEQHRWRTQAFFWKTIARACVGWMGEVEFCQRLSLSPGERSGDDVFREWTQLMVAAIRKQDKNHLITMGMLPFPNAYKAAAEELDFVSPQLYPKSGKVDEELALLKKFDWGSR
jgi:hypothetical protein